EDHDLQGPRRPLRPRSPRRERRRRHQRPGPTPQGSGEGRRRHPPGGARRDEEPMASPEEVDGLVPRHEADLRRASQRL
ncbi:MAG: hypothetical protein AVDCRST_MAG34-1647, partial [uncultured Nocardioidaceae bacterium]